MDFGAWKPSDVIAALALGFTVLAAISGLVFLVVNDTNDRKRIGNWLKYAAIWEGYRSGVIWGLNKLESFYGAPFSWRAFDRSLLIAFVYPIASFLIAWASGGPRRLSTSFWLPDDWVWWWRWLLFLTFITLFYAGLWLFRISEIPPDFISKRDGLPNWVKDYYQILIITIGLGTFLAVGAVVTGTFVPSLSVADGSKATATAGIVGLAFGVFSRKNSKFLIVQLAGMSLAGTIGLTVLILVGYRPDTGYTGISNAVLILGILPIINGAADFISLGVSRQLLERARTGSTLVWHICLDVVFAFVILFVLSVVLLLAMIAYNLTAANWTDNHFIWQDFFVATRREPWSGGLMVTLMLCSTLVPTFAHIFIATTAVFARPYLGQRKVAALLLSETEPRTSQKLVAVAYLMAACTFGVVGLFTACLGIWSFVEFMTGKAVGGYLYDWVMWIARYCFEKPIL